jgi:DnaJ-domain-containing protein 1
MAGGWQMAGGWRVPGIIIESFDFLCYINSVGIFDRLGDVLRSYLNEDDGRQKSSQYDRNYSNDPDVAEAFDELEQFLNGSGSSSGRRNNTDFGDARYGGGTADRSSPRPEKQAKPAVPEALRADFAELGVEFGADAEQCKSAHKRLLKIHHPDRHNLHEGNMKKATEKTARINASYERIHKWRETGVI